MSTIKRQIVEIPIHKLSGMDRMFGSMLNLDLENLPAKYKSAFDQTRDLAMQHFTMKGVYESYEVDFIDDDTIHLKSGIALESKLMTEIFSQSFELVFLVVSVTGYDELDAAEENMFHKLFLDNWGTAYIECANRWTEHIIAKELEEKGIYCTNAFSPGQNEIPMEMQQQIFQALHPEEIGVTLSSKYMMHPKKSVSGIFGIQTTEIENRIRPCDICEKRTTCPTAYDKLNR